tara:strand:+ start:1737 stop:2798 length:1062 start_codon:yes stop_codon:yes gene_type:complete
MTHHLLKGDKVMVWGLSGRTDLNNKAAVVTHPLVISAEGTPPRATAMPSPRPQFQNRIGVKVHNMEEEKVCVRPANLLRVGEDGMATLPNGNKVFPTTIVPSAAAPAPNEPTNLFQDMYELIEAPAPTNKYNDNRDPPPVRMKTREEALGPDPCTEVCPKYPQSTAARLVAYLLGKVDFVTPGVQADYDIQTASGWYFTRKRLVDLIEAGEENAAEVMHEEHLVTLHRKNKTPPEFLPAGFASIKERVAARQQKVDDARLAPAPDRERAVKAMQAVARNHSIKEDIVYECPRCGAHRPLGYRCCGMYMGMNGEDPVPRRNVHAHPEADEDELDDFLRATIARLDREQAEGSSA